MKILIDKKTKIVISVGDNIHEYDEFAYVDDDTKSYFRKSSSLLYDINFDVDFDVMVHPGKYLFKDNTIVKNPSYVTPYRTLSDDDYNTIISNLDYLMLLNDSDSATE